MITDRFKEKARIAVGFFTSQLDNFESVEEMEIPEEDEILFTIKVKDEPDYNVSCKYRDGKSVISISDEALKQAFNPLGYGSNSDDDEEYDLDCYEEAVTDLFETYSQIDALDVLTCVAKHDETGKLCPPIGVYNGVINIYELANNLEGAISYDETDMRHIILNDTKYDTDDRHELFEYVEAVRKLPKRNLNGK